MANTKTSPAQPHNAATLAGKTNVPRRPWRICISQCEDVYGGNEHFAVIEDAECGLIIADIEEWVDEESARLMSAAPELLAHLRTIAAEADASSECDDEPERTLAKIAEIAKLAIAKADGLPPDGNYLDKMHGKAA